MIAINGIHFSYEKTKVYEDFSLHIPEGQACLITGINGVGKSTLLRLIAGVLRPDKGEIVFDKKLGNHPKEKIGFISDQLSLYDSLSVTEGISLHKSVFGIVDFDDSLLKHTKIKPDSKIKSLSIGQRTIFHLSLILSSNPEVFLMDEVIHSIDAYLRKYFLEQLIRLLSERRLTVIMVNVNFHDIEHMVDRVILLKDKKIAVDEKIEDLKEKVKKVVSPTRPEGLPILSQSGTPDHPDYYIYPFKKEYRGKIKGDVEDMNLTEIVAAFIGGEYA